MNICQFYRKTIKAYKEGGVKTIARRAWYYIKIKPSVVFNAADARKALKNNGHILMINGCDALNPARYRMAHQFEQLKLAGVKCEGIYYRDVEDSLAEQYDIFYIFRCLMTEQMESLVNRAKELNKILIYDVDDLVFDPRDTDKLDFVKKFPAERKKEWDENELLMQRLMLCCDAAVSPTEKLNERISLLMPRSYIWRNRVSKYMVEQSEKAYENYKKNDSIIRIGYFSGSLTHNADFNIIKNAIIRNLKENKNLHLLLAGDILEDEELKQYEEQVEIKKYIKWQKLPNLIVQADINLAPLEDTEFNNCKSEIKWIEAALVRVPTIASDVGAFRKMIVHEKTGLLCKSNEEDWYNAIKDMTNSEEQRKMIGQNAYSYVMETCTTVSGAYEFADLINHIERDIT